MQRKSRSRAVDRGFVRVEPNDNVLVAYAAKDGTVASDGTGRNSPFTAALLKHIEKPGLEINFLFRAVRDDVIADTKRAQQPFVYGSLSQQAIYLGPPTPAAPTQPTAPIRPSAPSDSVAAAPSAGVPAAPNPAQIRDFLLRQPEILQEAMAELEKRQQAAEAEKTRLAVRTNSDQLFNSTRQVTLGNNKGDLTLVEFFDYNCGYCKRALPDLVELMKTDPKLKVVLKEFPILGPGSMEAAQVATAVRMQDKTGRKYMDFHQKLLLGRGQVDKARALAAAKEAGFDVARIEKDLGSDEIKASIAESMKLAEALGLTGTPSYVVGTDVVIGAVGLDALKAKVAAARK